MREGIGGKGKMTEPQQCFLEAYSERYSRGCPDCVYVNYSNCLRGRCENCPCPKCRPNKDLVRAAKKSERAIQLLENEVASE